MANKDNSLIKMHRAETKQKEIAAGYRKGYWLVRESDNQRFYIGLYTDACDLNIVARKVLSDKTGYYYWIDYCFGLDVYGKIAWNNIDCSFKFL